MIKFRTLVLIFLILPILGLSQYTPERDSIKFDKLNGAFFVTALEDTKDVFISPFKWDKKEWMIAGSTVALGLLLYELDDNIRGEAQGIRGSFTNNLSKYVLDPYGEAVYPAILFAGMYIYGTAANDHYTQTIALNASKAVALAGLTGFVIKQMTGRERPYKGDPPNPRTWFGPLSGSASSSFPSMHASVSFAAAAFLSSAYKDRPWIGISSYTMAALVGLSRINDDKHWASDVLFGAVIGYGVGKLVYRNMERRTSGGLLL